ncbi:hypothetical protein VQ248_004413 [Salmonella enterica]|nr:hypothetical protein [Salmonella enterica]EMD3364575.1 hypothetical protein [Salmonella enterica]EMD4307119.1 hypothetical protein [Salmonella enterica]EMD4733145.1 hypothetical protein [Salmonella enterica]EMD4792058.1 hypothetical protein [Salmonella enterica]
MGDSDKNAALFFVPDGREKRLMMVNKKHTIHHLLFFISIKTIDYNMMMMHEKSKMRRIPRPRSRPWRALPGSTFLI